jgi:hypothetical protein
VLIVAPIPGAFAKRTSPLVPLVAATVLGIVTFAALAGHHQQWQLHLGSAAWGTTVALGLVATFLLVVEAAPLADAGSAASMTTLGQAVGSAIGTAVFTAAPTSELVPGTPVPAAGGYTRAFVAAALFAAAALVCSLVTVPVTRARAPRVVAALSGRSLVMPLTAFASSTGPRCAVRRARPLRGARARAAAAAGRDVLAGGGGAGGLGRARRLLPRRPRPRRRLGVRGARPSRRPPLWDDRHRRRRQRRAADSGPAAQGLYPIFPCADGHVRLVVLAPRQWRAVRDWLGMPERFHDPCSTRSSTASPTPTSSSEHYSAFFATRGKDELTRGLDAAAIDELVLAGVLEAAPERVSAV